MVFPYPCILFKQRKIISIVLQIQFNNFFMAFNHLICNINLPIKISYSNQQIIKKILTINI